MHIVFSVASVTPGLTGVKITSTSTVADIILTTPEHCFLSKQDESHLSQQSKILMTNSAGQCHLYTYANSHFSKEKKKTFQNEHYGHVACITFINQRQQYCHSFIQINFCIISSNFCLITGKKFNSSNKNQTSNT